MAYNAIFLKESQTFNSFKRGIKNHQFDCNCRFCKRFVENLGFFMIVSVFFADRFYTCKLFIIDV